MRRLQQLAQLPREARDTLFLLLVIAWVMAPQLAHVPLWCGALSGLLLLWRGWIALRGRALPARGWLLLLLLLACAATWVSHHTLWGRDAGVTFVLLLLALKTLEMRASRDIFVVFFLGFFTLLSNFFFSQSLPTALAMLLGLLGLLSALVNHHLPVGRPPLLLAARTAAGMALLGLPLMLLLFLLFPRMAPLWGLPDEALGARTGLSAQMQVGSLARLALDDSVAMRIRFDGAMPQQSALYFRGPVFSSFDGRNWLPLRSGFPAGLQLQSQLQVSGSALPYAVTLEGNHHPWLPLLDATPEAPTLAGYTLRMGPDLQWRAERPIGERVQYQAQGYTAFRHGPLQQELGLQDDLDLPPGFNPRTLQFALELRRDPRYAGAAAPALVELLLEKLRTGGYRYTLEPGVYGRHSADEFWFDRKQGFCEHIASSVVLLLRALDVPARVVTGYQGGERNAVDGLWTVRQSDAHAWAEVWMAGQGWVRVDPTAAVAPARTGLLQRLLPPRSAVAQALGSLSPGLAMQLRALWEASNSRWNQWVLNYSEARQLDLLRQLGFEAPSWEDLATLLLGLVVVASLGGAAWARWQRLRQDPWLRLLQAANRRLQQAGLALPAGTPPRQLATALQDCAGPQDGAEVARIRGWLLRLEAWRYAPPGPGAAGQAPTLGTLRRQFRQLRWPSDLTDKK